MKAIKTIRNVRAKLFKLSKNWNTVESRIAYSAFEILNWVLDHPHYKNPVKDCQLQAKYLLDDLEREREKCL